MNIAAKNCESLKTSEIPPVGKEFYLFSVAMAYSLTWKLQIGMKYMLQKALFSFILLGN